MAGMGGIIITDFIDMDSEEHKSAVLAEFNKALQQPDLRKRLGDEGADPLGGTPAQFADLIRDDIARWGRTVKESGVHLD